MTLRNSPDPQSRLQIRLQVRAQRRALPAQQQEIFAQQFAGQFAKTHLFRNSGRIAFYMANDGELDPCYLMATAWEMGKHCYLPVLTPTHDKSLLFAPYEPDAPLVHNQFGIPEPRIAARHLIKARNLDLIIMPLVAGSRSNSARQSMKLMPWMGSPPIPTQVLCPRPFNVVWFTAS